MSDHDLPALGGATAAPRRPLLLATHSGSFHLDDAFAFVTLRLALGLRAPGRDHALLRSRDEAAFAGANLVWDVGAAYDPAAGRFDHHQRGAPVREDGTPLSAAGLVWRHYGEAAVRAALSDASDLPAATHGAPPAAALLAAAAHGEPPAPTVGAGDPVAAIAAAIDHEVVRRIDEIDNGVGPPGGALDLSAMVDDCNPAWDSSAIGDRAAEDAAFLRAAGLVEGFLRRRIGAVRVRLAAAAEVLAAQVRAADPRVIELDRKMPWQDAVLAHGLPALFAVYPVPNGNWMVDAMPTEPGGFEQRLPLPEAWAGLRDAALAEVSGVADAVFVHLRRFVGAARSRDGAMALARKAVAIGGRQRGGTPP